MNAADAFPRDARDLITPLHEMPYEEQVARKQLEMTQVLKRMARKVRQAWQQDAARELRKQRQTTAPAPATTKAAGAEEALPTDTETETDTETD